MIHQYEFVTCDHCNSDGDKDARYGAYTGFWEGAVGIDWQLIDGKHVCPDCWERMLDDEERDESTE